MPGHSYKGSAARPAVSLSVLAPTAVGGGGGELRWVYVYPNPPQWALSDFDGTDWTVENIVPGTDRVDSTTFNPGNICSVQAVDADGNPIGARSNVVTV